MHPNEAFMPPRVMVVDEDPAFLRDFCRNLRDQGYEPTGFASANEALAALKQSKFELLLCGLALSEMGGVALLRAARELDAELLGIVITGAETIDSALQALNRVAVDYILKPAPVSLVLPVLERAQVIRRLRIENAGLQRRLDARTTELEFVNGELDAFLYSVSHDLRAPVRAVSGFASFLEADFGRQLPPKATQWVEVIRSSASQMGRMIDSLLELSRLGRQHIAQEPVDVAALAGEVVAELTGPHAGNHAKIEVGALRPCVGDAALLRRVWENLLSNALKFTGERENARVEIGCREEEGQAVYFVRDNGVGFDSRYCNRLFTPFRRLHGPEFQGEGMGLAVVKRIVERHGGRVWAEAEVEVGASFYFTLKNCLQIAANGRI